MSDSSNETFIGIDLGTTYCSAAVFRNGKAEVIQFRGEYAIPSMVFYGIPNQYGFTAQSFRSNPEYVKSVIYDSKRMLGKTYKELENEIPNWTFNVEEDKEGNPVILVDNGKNLAKVKPCEVSASILNYIREELVKKGHPLDHVVITVPAHFTQKQLDEVRNAVRIAKFPNPENIFLFKEPSAAALCFTNAMATNTERTVLVYDFGGGTFDLSLVKVSTDKIEVVDQDGDTHLGGRDIDNGIVQDAIKKIKAKYPNADIDSFKGILVHDAEKAKKSIAATQNASVVSIQTPGEFIEYRLTKKVFEDIVEPLVKRTIKIVRKLMDSHKEVKVEYILLVGGTSLIYYVKEILEEEFKADNIDVLNSVDALTAVAIGAAQKSFFEYVKNERQDGGIEEIVPKTFPKKIIESVSITYGYLSHPEVNRPVFTPMITKGMKLPTNPVISLVGTVSDNQTAMTFQILQGESLEDSRKIGEYTINGLSGKKKAGEEKALTAFQVDEQNCLHMAFLRLDIENAKAESMDIDASKFLPSAQEADNSLTKMSKEQIEESREKIGVNVRNLDEELEELEAKYKELHKKAKKNNNSGAVRYCSQQINLILDTYDLDDDEAKKKNIIQIDMALKLFEAKFPEVCQ